MRGIERGFSVRVFAVACFAMLLVNLPHEVRGDSKGTDEPISAANLPSKDMFKSIPADYFLENAGQLSNQDIRFYTTSGNMQMGFAESAVLIKIVERSPAAVIKSPQDRELIHSPPPEPVSSRGVLLRLNFEGANKVTPQGRDPLPHPTNFFIGNLPSGWRTNVRSYREVVYQGLYDGVDLIYRATEKGVKYDFVIAPGTDVGIIKMSYEGADLVELDMGGNLVVHTGAGNFADSFPIAYQGEDAVQCSFVSLVPLSYGFVCNGMDKSLSLVIDPFLYSTYLGGGDFDAGFSVAVDSVGNAYVTGGTVSTDFPVNPGAFDTALNGTNDAFVAKLDSSGSLLLYSTYLGGSGHEAGSSVDVDSAGNAFITGGTDSTDFPVTPGAFQTTHNGSYDTFVAKLDSSGGLLLYSTYIGGSGHDVGSSLDVDSAGNAFIAGDTDSTDFPATPGAFQTNINGSDDAYVVKLSSTGSALVFATYLGGTARDFAYAIALDSAGNAYVGGQTDSVDFPTTPGALDTTYELNWDGFVAKLDSTGATLTYATYLDGESGEEVHGIVVDGAGSAIVAGVTGSPDFPVTPGSFDPTYNGNWGAGDAFVLKLNPSGSALTFSTFLGGATGGDVALGLAIDGRGNVYVAGPTGSSDFPMTSGAVDAVAEGMGEAFLASVDATGATLRYATYLGGSGWEYGYAVALGRDGSAFLVGATDSADFPVTPGAFDTTQPVGVSSDAFVAKLGMPNDPPTITITAPSGGELWYQGSSHTISWTASDGEDASSDLLVWINYTSGAGSGNICGAVAGNLGSCPWTLPIIAATDVVVNGTVIDTGGLRGFDESGPFTIQAPPNTPPTITITAPSGGEVWTQGSSQMITWTVSDNEDPPAALLVWINYTSSAGNGNICDHITCSVGSFSWTLPMVTATDVVINGTVVDTGDLKGYDESGQFTIRAPPPVNTPPTVTITSPSGGENWAEGSSHTINWTMHDNEDINANLTIYVNCTTGGVTSQIAAALKGQLSFAWTLPDIEANDVVVNITVIDSGGLKGWSQSGPFMIKAPPSPPPDFLSQYWWLVVVIVAVVTVLLLLALMRRRKPKEEKEEVTPSEPQNPPPS